MVMFRVTGTLTDQYHQVDAVVPTMIISLLSNLKKKMHSWASETSYFLVGNLLNNR